MMIIGIFDLASHENREGTALLKHKYFYVCYFPSCLWRNIEVVSVEQCQNVTIWGWKQKKCI